MADFPGREKWEAKLARELARVGRQELDAAMAELGDNPDATRLPPGFWDKYKNAYLAALRPSLQQIYIEAVGGLLEGSPVAVGWARANTVAADWAERYGFDLVRGLTDNTRSALQKQVSLFQSTPGMTLAQLRDSLAPTFGPVRAGMIATTEVTRSSAQGEAGTVRLLKEQGIDMIAKWNTNNDERVCPICGPRNQKKQGDGWTELPPAHPRCRCWPSWSFVRNK
jgi:hypothetical protein